MPDGSYSPVASGYAYAYSAANYWWWDPFARHIRPSNGGNPTSKTGLVDNVTPSFWQMETFNNVLTNDWLITRSEQTKRKVADQWAYIQSVPAFTPAVLAGNGAGVTINISDDAAWHCMYLMHVHMVTGDPLALAYLSEAIPYNLMRFADPNTSGTNPNTLYDKGRSTNLPGINYGTSPNNIPFRYNKYGMLYATIGSPEFNTYGYTSTLYEAYLAVCALYVYEQLCYTPYLDYARNVFKWMFDELRTPADSNPAAKIQGIYETELVLNPNGGVPLDPTRPRLDPVNNYYGKPIRGVDSTYLGGALALAVLAARLSRTFIIPADDRTAYAAEATSIANAIISPRAYGRTINGKTVIANTREPWTQGHLAVPFAQEVLALPGVNSACATAFVNTAENILATCFTSESRLTGDWAGGEPSNLTPYDTWQQTFDASPGEMGGAQQIMTHSETLAMVQAGLVIDRRNRAMPYRSDLYGA